MDCSEPEGHRETVLDVYLHKIFIIWHRRFQHLVFVYIKHKNKCKRQQVCVQLLTYADNVALPVFACRTHTCSRGFATVGHGTDIRTYIVPFNGPCMLLILHVQYQWVKHYLRIIHDVIFALSVACFLIVAIVSWFFEGAAARSRVIGNTDITHSHGSARVL